MALFLKTRELQLKSFTRDSWYKINTVGKTCSCPSFSMKKEYKGGCKHLKEMGLYRLPSYTSPLKPTFSQSLSALVKCIRLRKPQDAIYWLLYLRQFTEAKQIIRVQRRILICSAEDGHSIPTMEKVVSNFSALKKDVQQQCAEVFRICKTKNWWEDEGGRDYIYSGLVGYRRNLYQQGSLTPEEITTHLGEAIENQDKISAMQWLSAFGGIKTDNFGPTKQAELVQSIAKEREHNLAQRLCAVHLKQRSALSWDNNFIGQAVWMLAGGTTDLAEKIEPVFLWEVKEAMELAKVKLINPTPIPSWCIDGIHCAGGDPRFAGCWQMMNGVCKAYQHYGRVDPQDKWLPEFLVWDGLQIKRVVE